MEKLYIKTAKVGIFKACLRFIEDPNRNILLRLALAASPLLAVWVLSPFDLLPEIIVGPLGLTDDILITAGIIFLVRLANGFYKEKRYNPKYKIQN
jgi:uncharacterized membrane protein YkvA (DUF1232 family)